MDFNNPMEQIILDDLNYIVYVTFTFKVFFSM